MRPGRAWCLPWLVFLAAGSAFSSGVVLDDRIAPVGGYVVATVPGAEGAGEAEAFGRKFPMFPAGNGTLRAILPVPLGTRAGSHILRFGLKNRALSQRLRVTGLPARPVRELKGLLVNEERVQSLRNEGNLLAVLLLRASDRALWSETLRPPVAGRLSSPFGVKRRYGGGAEWVHRGVDYAAASGWPVVAPAAGVVLLARRMESYGNTVLLDHGQTVLTVYMHMKSLCVGKGDKVAEGQVIGQVGQTGMAAGPHLHFGVFIHGVAVDPAGFLERGLP